MKQIWYYDTRNKAGWADVWVFDINKKKAYMFEARESNRVYRTIKTPTVISFITTGYTHLDTVDDELFELKYKSYFNGIKEHTKRV